MDQSLVEANANKVTLLTLLTPLTGTRRAGLRSLRQKMLLNLPEVPQHPKCVKLPQGQTKHGGLLWTISISRMSE